MVLRELARHLSSQHDMSDLSLHIEYELNEDVRELVCRLLDTLSETGATYIGLREKQDLYPLG
jgi:hypothetical protein